ncbi:MAG: N-acetyl-gamma-glutamyl-phosphate reductase [Brevinematales bacterium]|nr:N-acetyl-gamma-glutamyl-phosphate reductase [Brevinematales bacterium]
MKWKIFVDGQSGTTGLKINERLNLRNDLEILSIPEEKKKDPQAKKDYLNSADIVFLCLPDEAAKESVTLISNPKTKVIDASTAHRVHPEWTYGLVEYEKNYREKIKNSKRICVPGCHATGFILALYPLVKKGIVPVNYPITAHSITGYSGGGKKLIEKFETNQDKISWKSTRHYALNLTHKHLPEMTKYTLLSETPIFTPIVGNFYNGMVIGIPLYKKLVSKNINLKDIYEVLSEHYANEPFVKVYEGNNEFLEEGYFDPTACNGTNMAEIFVFGNEEQFILLTRLDNLGKGASGAAIQIMNLLLDVNEETGL